MIASLALACATLFGPSPQSLSLDGEWRFQLDRRDVGESEGWFDQSLPDSIRLPGALQNQGFGDPITVDTKWTGSAESSGWLTNPRYARYRLPGQVKVPFFLQPERHYVGSAWYQRDFDVPRSWQGKRLLLSLERAHWEARAWVDGHPVGAGESLSAPDRFELGTGLSPGRHQLTLRINNRLLVDVGSWAHSVTDHTQGNWNGVVGKIAIQATSPVSLADIQAFPDAASRSVRLNVRIGNHSGKPGTGKLRIGNKSVPVKWGPQGGTTEATVSLGGKALLWDEYSPSLHRLTVTLTGPSAEDKREVVFGLRAIAATKDGHLTINGRKIFLRGTLECCIFPKTGYPPTDVTSWRHLIATCKSYGLNHIRFHSWCPPEAAFEAADQLGFYLSVEVAAWTRVGDGAPIDGWLYREAERILSEYGNHPSFVLMPYGNEPSGPNMERFLTTWVAHWRKTDPRRLYTGASGWPKLEDNQYDVSYGARGPSGWLGNDYSTQLKGYAAPYIVHEMGQWCVFPDLSEIDKYTGPLKARNFEIVRDSLNAAGLFNLWPSFLLSSGKLQTLCYKEEIEAALRTPGIGGFQLLDLHDFPGQGTALVGVLNAFWQGKGYVTAEQFREFCGSTVPLVNLKKRVWTSDETLTCDVRLAHYGPAPLNNAKGYWKLLSRKGQAVAEGTFPMRAVPIGRGALMGTVRAPLRGLEAPAAYRLIAGLTDTSVQNEWNVWVYPREDHPQANSVKVVSRFDEATLRLLEQGNSVLLASDKLPATNPKGSFTPVFWNRLWFPGQECTTLGLLVQPDHAALKSFPTEPWTDWQWEPILRRSRCVLLDSLPRSLTPIVRWIDDWNTNRSMALIFECRVSRGRLLVCAADLQSKDGSPSARQLLKSLLNYMSGPAFKPTTVVETQSLRDILSVPPSQLETLAAHVVRADSEDASHGNVVANVMDGDPNTIWHTKWDPVPDPMPHSLILDLGRDVVLRGLKYLPRQDMANGRIASAEIAVSSVPGDWKTAAEVAWPNSADLQKVVFSEPRKARFLKITVRSEVNGNAFAAIAELDVILQDSRSLSNETR